MDTPTESASLVQQLEDVLGKAAGIVWGPPLIVLLLGTHLFLTFRLGFIQRFIPRAIRLTFRKPSGEGDISHFGALTTALAATVGTGNIIGVASAIVAGGPGAVLWMWLTGVFGIATKYGEAVLAVKYRTTNARGEMAGGPMYVLERGLKMKWLGVVFAVFTALAGFGIGNMTQSNAVVNLTLENLRDFEPLAGVAPEQIAHGMGLLLAALTAAVILGGVKWIANVCKVLVPFMALIYVVGCLVLLGKYWGELGNTIQLIVTSAFTPEAAGGGLIGAGIREVIQAGVARGLFSNESGLGSAPIAAAAAKTRNPVEQALVSASGTFWDTVVICAVTGLVLVSTGHWEDGLAKDVLAREAFRELGPYGPTLLAFGLGTFVFSTILGWSYYGEKAVEYLFGIKAILPYRILWVAVVYIGAVLPLSAVWNFSDVMNGLMAVPNLIALLLLSGVIAAETRRHIDTTRTVKDS